MDFFKKRSAAIAVFAAVVIAFTLIGSHCSLTKACRKAEEAFFDKDLLQAKDYYTCPGDQLENCVALANRLLSVIGRDGQWRTAYDALAESRRDLADALDGRDISAIGTANDALSAAVEAVKAAARAGAPLRSGSDDYSAIISDFDHAQALVGDPAYRDHIENFLTDDLGRFPAGVLMRLTGVKAPEVYP